MLKNKLYVCILLLAVLLQFVACNKEEVAELPISSLPNDSTIIREWYLVDTLEGELYEEFLIFKDSVRGEISTLLDGEPYYRIPFEWRTINDNLYMLVTPEVKEFTYSVNNDTLMLTFGNITSFYTYHNR